MAGFAGFDCSGYPGAGVMAWLLGNGNLVWCGYYLGPAPSHPGTGWMGTRAGLQAAGWGLAPVYVGQQVTGPGSLNPSAAQGTVDGQQAAQMMADEGFGAGSYVYLDLENGPPMPQAQADYVTSWCAAVAAGGYGGGVYCSHLLASAVSALVPSARVWAFKVGTTATHDVAGPYPNPDPSGCGFAGATAWQRDDECVIQVPVAAGGTLQVDLDTALTADPGAPDA
jgi:hypothetical protein